MIQPEEIISPCFAIQFLNLIKLVLIASIKQKMFTMRMTSNQLNQLTSGISLCGMRHALTQRTYVALMTP